MYFAVLRMLVLDNGLIFVTCLDKHARSCKHEGCDSYSVKALIQQYITVRNSTHG